MSTVVRRAIARYREKSDLEDQVLAGAAQT